VTSVADRAALVSAPTGETTPRSPLRRVMSLARPVWGRLALSSLLGACSAGTALALVATSAWLISRSAEHPPESALALAIVGVQFFALSRGLFRYGERVVGHDAALRFLSSLRSAIYERLETMAPTGVEAYRSGDLLARLVSDVDALQDLLLRVLPPFATAAIVGSATVIALWLILPVAAVAVLVSVLVASTTVPWLTGVLARKREAAEADARGELTALFVDLVQGADDLAVSNAWESHLSQIAEADRRLTAVSSGAASTAGMGRALTTFLASSATWLGLVLGVAAVHEGHLSGVYLAVVALVPLASFDLVVGLPVATQVLTRVRSSAARVFSVVDGEAPVEDPSAPSAVPPPPYDVRVAALASRYPRKQEWAIEDVDLSLPNRQRVAIIGPSGAGKSALAATLVRFIDYEQGTARLADVELNALAGDEVREMIGLLGQDAHLFDTTIEGNLRVARPDAGEEQLSGALSRVGLGDWLEQLPEGLRTEVGEGGSRLSGGQRQRVALARALLADQPVLVLDEPAEHLDQVAADAMTADLLDLTAQRSTILITHLLAGLEEVDEIVVLDASRVVERGRHEALIEAGGHYSELWWREMEARSVTLTPSGRPQRPRRRGR
jgi:thiol reductant ABC exporter CydC subunit